MADARTPIRDTLARARRQLVRLTPEEAHAAHRDGALLIDVRIAEQRAEAGAVAGAVAVSLNHLEWRLDPEEPTCLPEAGDLDRPVIVLCQEGYCSSLAAARLKDLGYRQATDVIGGVVAWGRAGLPLVPDA